MKTIKLGLIQGNFRNAFTEQAPEIQRISDYRETLKQEDIFHNHKKLLNQIETAASQGAELIVTPESYLDGWSFDTNILQQSTVLMDSPQITDLKKAALKFNIWLCAGVFLSEGDHIYNSALLINAAGEIVLTYRKTHETTSVLKQMPYDLGNELPIVETPWGRIGILICHDRWYGENFRTLRMKGAELVLNPVAAATFWPGHPFHQIHNCSLRGQAYSNSLFVASCNCTNHGGHSLIIAPDGSIIAKAGLEETILLAKLDKNSYPAYDFISNLRPDVYR